MPQTRTEEFDAPQPIAVRIQHGAGSVLLLAGQSATTTVELVDRGADHDRGWPLIEKATVELRGGELHIEVPDRPLLMRHHPQVAITVRLPARSEVRATLASAELSSDGTLGATSVVTASGAVRLADVAGDLTVETASGDVSVGNTGGQATLRSRSGTVELRHAAGEVHARNASGDIRIGVAEESVRARTASGAVTVRAAHHGLVEAHTASGEIGIGVAPGVGLWLDVATKGGYTASDLAISQQATDADAALRVIARSASGDVRITRAVRTTV